VDFGGKSPGKLAAMGFARDLQNKLKASSVSVEGQAPTASVKPETSATSQEIPTGSGIQKEVGIGGGGSNEPAAQEQVAAPISDDQHVSTIANRFTEERTKSGELGEIAPGQGYSTRELADAGLKMTPEQINQHVSDLMNGTGDPIEQGKAVRAEEARLSQRSNDLSRAAAADPTNIEARTAADNAFKDVTDFHNGPVAKLKTIFHATGVGLQGELPFDLSTFNGLREKFLKDTGKPPTPEQEPQLKAMADKVDSSIKEDNGAKQSLGQAIDKATARRKLPTYDEVRQNIADRMKIEPCRT
jgi:cytochrome c556